MCDEWRLCAGLLVRADMALNEYTTKRKFERTPEPAPGPGLEAGRRMFVVHKHAARALHYDLRLELEGVLKSWAVPKGPTLDPSLKRLAVMVEDHPLAYHEFEGVIPEKNYGAGSVIIWDRGFYHHPSAGDEAENEGLLLEGLRKGNLKFVLEGEKLRGEFALVRTGKAGRSWLLLKKRDRVPARGNILRQNRSVVSHKTLEDMIEDAAGKAFRRNKVNQIRLHEAIEMDDLKDAPVRPMPQNIQPMLATLTQTPFDHRDWIFEVKWDGYRALAEVRGSDVSLYSRNGISFNKKYPLLVEALQKLGSDAVLDGEIVVVDDQGRSDFQMLQHYQDPGSNGAAARDTAAPRNSTQAGRPRGHLLYAVFDLLYFRGHDLTGLPLLRRKELLKKILPASPVIRFSDHVREEGILFYTVAIQKGLEGIIAKQSQSAYAAGSRSRQWRKVKMRHTQDGVIAGFTEPGGARNAFGSLVLGAFEGNELVYIGNVGTGFTAKQLKDVREKLEPLVSRECPFATAPETNAPVTWVRPELVCEVSLAEWTDDASMRHPVFLRLREDKTAADVTREEPVASGKGGQES